MSEPAVIRKLDQVVVNRIAAGEVIQRPANALKELIENSLDAKSTNIQITVKNGGLKYLQIQDNGSGIRKEDFEIVCERFTTSKLREFEDLSNISTYGFRGEALASISHVAHLTILSRTAQGKCAYKASYEDGKVKGAIKPIAGNQGTQITVEDLFYNMNIRRTVLRSATEEYQKIADIVGKYAIHNFNVGFGLKKFGANNDIRTPPNSNPVDNIRTVYGNDIARELLETEYVDEELKFKMKGHISNVNYSKKNFIFILFINHRLVDCQGLKKSIDEVYMNYLPKNAHPFVYMSLELDPHSIDVNIHPTKHEVHFLYEEQIVERVIKELERKLLGSNSSRTFYTQAKLPGFKVENTLKETREKSSEGGKSVYDKDLVRTNAQEQKLDKFFGTPFSKPVEPNTRKEQSEDKSQSLSVDDFVSICKGNNFKQENVTVAPYHIEKRTELTSVLQLCKSIEDNCHRELRKLFSQHVWVGCINANQSMVQHNTQLYVCNTKKLMEELFYQIILYYFGNFGVIRFSGSLPVYELALLALQQPDSGWTEEDGPKEELAQRVTEILKSKAMIMEEYFSVTIDEEGVLKTLPLLIEKLVPQVEFLPMYILRLATEVNWDEEKECFRTFARETASFYSEMIEVDAADEGDTNWKWVTEHILYPHLKKLFLPPKEFAQNGYLLEVANLPNLYKVFERC